MNDQPTIKPRRQIRAKTTDRDNKDTINKTTKSRNKQFNRYDNNATS